MKFHLHRNAAMTAANYQWHPWFAWHPVRVNASWAWLRRIERRDCNPPDAEIYWEYRWKENQS